MVKPRSASNLIYEPLQPLRVLQDLKDVALRAGRGSIFDEKRVGLSAWR